MVINIIIYQGDREGEKGREREGVVLLFLERGEGKSEKRRQGERQKLRIS